MKRFYEENRLNKKWIDAYCMGDYSLCVRRELEEKGLYHPDNMMPDGSIDKNL